MIEKYKMFLIYLSLSPRLFRLLLSFAFSVVLDCALRLVVPALSLFSFSPPFNSVRFFKDPWTVFDKVARLWRVMGPTISLSVILTNVHWKTPDNRPQNNFLAA